MVEPKIKGMEINNLTEFLIENGMGEFVPDKNMVHRYDKQWLVDLARSLLPVQYEAWRQERIEKALSRKAEKYNEMIDVDDDILHAF